MANGDSPRKQGTLSNLLLPAALAALAIAVAILAWIVLARLDALDKAHKEIKEAVEQRLTTKHFDARIDELERLIGLLRSCCDNVTTITEITNPRVELMFDNASLMSETGLPLDELSTKSPGIVLSDEQEIKLDKLADALIACATPPSESVSLKVQGYSSTRPFKGTSVSISNELNLSAANLRAEVVIDHLVARVERDPIGKSRVDIRYEPWLDYEDIQRPFEDKARFSGMDQEQLNRVVYIDLLDAGGCERTT